MNKLLGLVTRAMAIDKLTDLHISIPHVPLTTSLVSSRRVSFARRVTVIEAAPEYAAV